MSIKVISGGQTGADQAGWRAAKRCGLETGGWMPKGFLTEAGPRPEFAEMYGAKEHPSREYRGRTISNIGLADGTLLFGDPRSAGAKLAQWVIDDLDGTHMLRCIETRSAFPPFRAVEAIRRWKIRALNVAGNRESKAPGIGAWVEEYLVEMFSLLHAEDA